MTRPPLVSVLIPAFNSERWLGEAIESALAQTHPHVEVIVVDDGSTDGTLGVARCYEGDRVQVIAQENAGACVARNSALVEARGEFVKFLDADDVLLPDAIEAQFQHLASQPDGGRVVSFGWSAQTDKNLVPLPGSLRHPLPGVGAADLAERVEALLSYNIQTSLPLHKREWLVEVGGFQPHIRQGQEYDLHLRLALTGVRFLYLERIIAYIRKHDSPLRLTNSSWLLSDPESHLCTQEERIRQFESELGSPLPAPLLRIVATSMWGNTRLLVRAGQTQIAERYARLASTLDPKMKSVGGAFRTLGMLCGPVRAERALMRGRQFLGGM